MRNNILLLWDGDRRTYFAVEHAAHDKFIDFSSSCPRAAKKHSGAQRCARITGSERAVRLTISAVTDEEGHTLENEDESGRRLCEYWRTIFQARQEGPRRFHHEEILRFVQ